MLPNKVKSRRSAKILGIDKRYSEFKGGLDEWYSLHRVMARRKMYGGESGGGSSSLVQALNVIDLLKS